MLNGALAHSHHTMAADQVNIYRQWTNTMYGSKYDGWNFWMLVTDNYPNYDGFAIGRSIWWEPCAAYRKQRSTRDDAVNAIADRYTRYVDVWRNATA